MAQARSAPAMKTRKDREGKHDYSLHPHKCPTVPAEDRIFVSLDHFKDYFQNVGNAILETIYV